MARVECAGGAADDVVGGFAFALEQQVRLADGVGFGVDLLAVEVGGDVLVVLGGELPQGVLGHGEHAAGAAGAVVEQVGAGPELLGNGEEDQPGHEAHGVAWRPVLAGLLVVLLVEAAHQLFEDRAHAVVVEAGMPHRAVGVQDRGGAQIDVGAVSFSTSAPKASALDRRGSWLRNSKLSRMSWTLGEKPSR